MSKRRDGRILAVQFLYQLDVHPTEELEEAFVGFWEQTEASLDLQKYARELVMGVLERREQLDEWMKKYIQNWELARLSPVDRNILRLALYEMHYREDVPPIASMNEAIDIAKSLGSEDSGKFVNGVLDRAKLDVKRSLR